MHKGIVIWFISALVWMSSTAQTTTLVSITAGDTTYTDVGDTTQARAILRNTLREYRSQNYLSASVDRFTDRGDTILAEVYQGSRFDTVVLAKHNFGSGYLKDSTQVVLEAKRFYLLTEDILKDYEEAGFPFANIEIKDVDIQRQTVVCTAKLYPHVQVVYDSLEIIGDSKLSKRYLQRYLDVVEGDIYREDVVRAIDNKLQNLPLVKLNQASRVVFYRGLARIVIDIDDIVTDRIDGVVGFAPNSANKEDQSLLLTGEVNIELNNLFKSGKQFELHWRNYLERSQRLGVQFTYPYILYSKIGVHGGLDINKFDTVFVNLAAKLSFRYQRRGNNYLEFYYQTINSNLITADTVKVRNTKQIPDNNSYHIDNYGMRWSERNFDFLPNPRKGFSLALDGALGRKTILRNTQVDLVKYINSETGKLISVYDTLNKQSLRAQVEIDASFFLPIAKQSTIKQHIYLNALFAESLLFNELHNFGGFSTLRGFDENEIFASKVLRYTAEYRYLIDRYSNVGLFINLAMIENTLESDALLYDTPLGFGVLANIKVGSGTLNMAYALGKRLNNPLEISRGKFHFGIVNYF